MSLLTSRNITGGTELLTNPTLDNNCSGWVKREYGGAGNTVELHEGYARIITTVHPQDDNGIEQYIPDHNYPVVVRLTVRGNGASSGFSFYTYSIDGTFLGPNPIYVAAGETKTLVHVFPSMKGRITVRAYNHPSDFDVLEFSAKSLHGGTPTQQRLISSSKKATSSNVILNPNFSSGLTNWTVSTGNGHTITAITGGVHFALNNLGQAGELYASIQQSISAIQKPVRVVITYKAYSTGQLGFFIYTFLGIKGGYATVTSNDIGQTKKLEVYYPEGVYNRIVVNTPAASASFCNNFDILGVDVHEIASENGTVIEQRLIDTSTSIEKMIPLSGSGSSIRVPITNVKSVSLWVKTSMYFNQGASLYLIDTRNGGNSYLRSYDSGGVNKVYVNGVDYQAIGEAINGTWVNRINRGQWVHVYVEFTGVQTGTMYIGARYNDIEHMQMNISDIALLNDVLTTTEAVNVYSTKNIPSAKVIKRYDLSIVDNLTLVKCQITGKTS